MEEHNTNVTARLHLDVSSAAPHVMRRLRSSEATQTLPALLPFLVSSLLNFLCKFPFFLELLIAFPFPVLKTLGLFLFYSSDLTRRQVSWETSTLVPALLQTQPPKGRGLALLSHRIFNIIPAVLCSRRT